MTATTVWYLAEGCTDGGMETWVLVQNPGDIDAIVNLDFQTGWGLVAGPELHNETLPPNSRKSYNVGAFVSSFNVSTKVTATQGTIICERAMYGNGRAWGHESIGVTEPRHPSVPGGGVYRRRHGDLGAGTEPQRQRGHRRASTLMTEGGTGPRAAGSDRARRLLPHQLRLGRCT